MTVTYVSKSGSRSEARHQGLALALQLNEAIYSVSFNADAFELVETVKTGVPPQVLDNVAGDMDYSKDKLMLTLGLPRATIQRKAAKQEVLSPDASSRLIGIARLIGQVESMVIESGDPDGFDAAKWVAKWLDENSPALGGRRPAEFMDTSEGQQLVSRLLAQAQSGAYA